MKSLHIKENQIGSILLHNIGSNFFSLEYWSLLFKTLCKVMKYVKLIVLTIFGLFTTRTLRF